MKKRLLSCLLCLCMVFALLPTAALAAGDLVTRITITMDEPAVGKTPAATASIPSKDSTYVKSVTWYGEFDADGKFKPGMKYTVDIVVCVKDGIDRTIQLSSKSNVTINGAKVTNGSVDASGKVATLQYYYGPFKTPEGYVDSSEFGYLSSGSGKVQNVAGGKTLSVYDLPDDSGRTQVGTLKNGDTVEIVAAYVGGSYHAIRYNGGTAYIPAYKDNDLITENYVAVLQDNGPAGSSAAGFSSGDIGFASANDFSVMIYKVPRTTGYDLGEDFTWGNLLMGEDVFVLGAYLFGDGVKPNFHAVAYQGHVGYVEDKTGKVLTDVVVLGKQPLMGQSDLLPASPPVKAQEIMNLPTIGFNPQPGVKPQPGVAPQLMQMNTQIAVGASFHGCTAESIAYEPAGPMQPYSWVTATVTYKAKEGYVFRDKYALPIDSSIAVSIDCKSKDTVTVTYTVWVGGGDQEVKPTQAMIDYAEAHEDDAANSRTAVATGQRNDPVGDMPVSEFMGDLSSARVWKFPTMAETASIYYGDARLGRVEKQMNIYDLHAETRFPGTVGQWYEVSCDGKLGFVPAAYVKNVKTTGAQGDAPTPMVGDFTDVRADAYYADAVRWAVKERVTAGTSYTTFSPAKTCTRGEILTFLWRAVGSPAATAANPFTDVKEGDFYYKATLWAAEKGMVTGSTFGANTPCTRAATVTYLWQNAGSPAASATASFTDVPAGAAYAQAVAWAVEQGVTSGTSATAFSPNVTCDRGQIVTFLYRALN